MASMDQRDIQVVSCARGLASLAGALLVAGCAGAPMRPADAFARAREKLHGERTYHLWLEVYELQPEGAATRRIRRGYVDHQYTEEDRDGLYLVKDLSHEDVGFVLPSGKAYIFRRDAAGAVTSEEVVPVGVELSQAVQRILDVRGEAELREVAEKSTSPGETPPGSGR